MSKSDRTSPGKSRKGVKNSNLDSKKKGSKSKRWRRGKSNMSLNAALDYDQKMKSDKNCCVRFIMKCCPGLYSMPANKWFDNTILVLIFTSSVMLTLDNPLNDPNSMETTVY